MLSHTNSQSSFNMMSCISGRTTSYSYTRASGIGSQNPNPFLPLKTSSAFHSDLANRLLQNLRPFLLLLESVVVCFHLGSKFFFLVCLPDVLPQILFVPSKLRSFAQRVFRSLLPYSITRYHSIRGGSKNQNPQACRFPLGTKSGAVRWSPVGKAGNL